MRNKYCTNGLWCFVVALIIFTPVLHGAEFSKVDNFTLKDVTGKAHSLTDYKDSKAIVVMFIATRCPVSNAYNKRMAQLFEDYRGRGVTFVGINANKQESVEEMVKHARDNNLGFTILKDENNIIADKMKAQFTPEIFVMNPALEILYHGRIDDSMRDNDIKTHDLRTALDEILAGKPVSTKETKAFGCTIKRVSK